MTSTSSDRSINFNVTTGNNIQVYYYYRYSGGSFPYSYSLYSKADAAGSPYFTSVNTETSPQTIASIPNFCGVTNLALSIKKSVYDSSSNQISISVVPSFLSSIPFPVQLNLTCSTVTTSQTRISSSNSTDLINFNLPSGYLPRSSCYFVASSMRTPIHQKNIYFRHFLSVHRHLFILLNILI